jgi:hypothetical protein
MATQYISNASNGCYRFINRASLLSEVPMVLIISQLLGNPHMLPNSIELLDTTKDLLQCKKISFGFT